MMNRVASAPSCSAFIHRVALEEVRASGSYQEQDREIGVFRHVAPAHSPRGPSYLRGIPNPANVSENGIRAYRHVFQYHLQPQSHHSGQPAHQGRIHSTRHATLGEESRLETQNPQLAFDRHQSTKSGSLEEKKLQDTKENLRKSKRLGIWD